MSDMNFLNSTAHSARFCSKTEQVAVFFYYLSSLTEDEGDSVVFCCQNPEGVGDDNEQVICNGSWTDFEDRRYNGHTVFNALRYAFVDFKIIENAANAEILR